MESSEHSRVSAPLSAKLFPRALVYRYVHVPSSLALTYTPPVTPAADLGWQPLVGWVPCGFFFLVLSTGQIQQERNTNSVWCQGQEKIFTHRARRQTTQIAGTELNSGVLIIAGGLFFLTYLHFILLVSYFHLCHSNH